MDDYGAGWVNGTEIYEVEVTKEEGMLKRNPG